MLNRTALLVLAGSLLAAPFAAQAAPPAATTAPAGTVQQGTFASEQLQKDVLQHMYVLLRNDGCQELLNVVPFLRAQPEGEMGSRNWSETWVFECSNGRDEIDARFQETPHDGGADYSVSSATRHTFGTPAATK
ncbi:MAG: hypothetical protein ACN6RG_02030 [Stenotrophomonas sp.]